MVARSGDRDLPYEGYLLRTVVTGKTRTTICRVPGTLRYTCKARRFKGLQWIALSDATTDTTRTKSHGRKQGKTRFALA
jgi:hypothetical protein